jgi:hypothetical protein
MRLSLLVPVALFGLAVFACSDKPDPNDPSQVQPTGYPPGYPTQPVPTQTVPAPTATTTAPTAAPGSPAQPVAVGMAGPLGAALLAAAAAGDAKGMQPEGGSFAGQFQQGQVLEQLVNLEPNKCYTVVAMGGPGITELDVQLVPNAPIPLPLAQDNQTGPNATLGGGGNCWRNNPLTAIPGKVIIRATGGSGIAIAQVYKK